MGFAVAVHVADVGFRYLGAVETVQEPSGDLRHQGPVRDGLGHAVDRPLEGREGEREGVSDKPKLIIWSR